MHRIAFAPTTLARQVLPAVFVALATAMAQPARAEDCMKCHAGIVKHKNVHGAVNMGDCTECHVPTKSGKGGSCKGGSFELSQPEPQLCFDCHDVQNNTPLHEAIGDDGCTACHDPHSSDYRPLLKAPTPKEMCAECHDKGDGEGRHTAVAKGQCTDCHDPHSGVDTPLLKYKKDELCQHCHKVDEQVLGGHKHLHAPAAERRCTACHDPHGSKYKPNLKDEPIALCLTCHDVKNANKPGTSTRSVDVNGEEVHPALEVGSCLDCHAPHGSDYLRLLRKPQPAICHDCHDRQDEGHDYVHSAVRLGQCSTCHDPHSGKRPPIMRFATTREMCFACHADDLTGRKYVHMPAKGDCTACHHPHGSNVEKNLRAPGKELCYRCHMVMDDVKVKHPALEIHGCTTCHDPHGTANRSFLIKPVNALCTSCHPDKTDGKHVTGTEMIPGGHRVEGPRDPRRPGRTLSCASCHNPHGSDNQHLLRQGGAGMQFCVYCHTKGGRRVGDAAPDKPNGVASFEEIDSAVQPPPEK